MEGAEVKLVHKFQGKDTAIPCTSLYTDGEGRVVLKLGRISYNERVQPAEDYYWVYINGRNTGVKVSSEGRGEVHYIRVDIGGWFRGNKSSRG